MVKGVSKPRSAKAGKVAQLNRGPKDPVADVAKPKKPKPAAARRKSVAKPRTLASAVTSLYDTAIEIVADRAQPTIDQVKELALAVIGHEEKKARKAQAKAERSSAVKKPKKAKSAEKAKNPGKK